MGYAIVTVLLLVTSLAWFVPWFVSPALAVICNIPVLLVLILASGVFAVVGSLGLPSPPTPLEMLEQLPTHTCSCGKEAIDKEEVRNFLKTIDP